MAQQLRLTLLGSFQLSAGATALTTVATPRLQGLLALLVLRRGVRQSRQQLAFRFWPDSSDAQARTNLRTLLHRLRAALPDADGLLTIDGRGVCWRADAPLTSDVADFEAALARADEAAGAGDDEAARQALERAAALYQGDLLPDCYDEWVLPERERLQGLAFGALERLVAHLEQRRAYAPALEHARRLLQLDPLREESYRRLMRLHAASGDRAGALRVFHACATTLRDELATEPGPATRAAYELLLAAAPQPAAAPLAASAPLVGRAVEWTRAQAIWQAAAGGRTRLLTLAGEAGIGKTRLAEELLVWAGRQGAATASARCYAAEGELAYGPIIEWLHGEALRRRLPQLDALWLAEVARLAPEVRDERPDLPPAGPLSERWQRRRLFEALARAVLLAERPLLLLLDDMQWCDRDTLEWLRFLLRYEPRARLLVVATVRSEEVGPEVGALLADVRRGDQLSEIGLGPLSQAETITLAGHITGGPLSAAAVAGLYAETEGNPLFVVESVRAAMLPEAERHAPAELAVGAATRLPPGVQAVISRRLGQLSPPARELLQAAAVIGRSFTFGVLARAADDDEATLVRALDELWQRRIVRERGADAYDFSHDKLRAVAYEGLSAARRRVLHRRVAEALEAEHGADPAAVSGQIAAHFERGGQAERAIAYYRRAADVAQQLYANGEAIEHLRRALALLAAPQPRERPTAAALGERLGDLLHLTGRHDEALDCYHRALALVAGHEQHTSAQLQRKIGNIWRDQQRYDDALAAYAAAEAALAMDPGSDDPERWQIWLELQFERALTSYWLAEAPEMFRIIEAARPVVERYGSPVQRARLYLYRAHANLRRDRNLASTETVELARAYLATIEQGGATAALPAARFALGHILTLHDNLDGAEEQLRAALELAERSGDVSLEARCLTYLTIGSRRRGRLDATRTLAERSLRVATAEQMPDYIGAAHANLAWLAWRTADLAEARRRGQQALAAWQTTALVFSSQWTGLWPLIGVALAEGQVAEAVAHARALLDPRQQRTPEPLEALLEAAVRGADAGDLAAARAALARAEEPARALGYL